MSALFLLAIACAPKHAPEPDVNADPLAQRPEVGPPPAFTPDTPVVFTLAEGGPTVTLMQRPGLPLVSLRVVVPGGAASDPADRPGLAHLADTLLTRGAGGRDASAFALALEQDALTLEVATYGQASVVQLDAHAQRLDLGLSLMADALLRPRFDADEVARARDQLAGEVAQALDDPRAVAARAGDALYYGEGHPLARPASGTLASIPTLDAEVLRASWAARYTGAGAAIVVVGDIDQAELTRALSAHLGPWLGAGEAQATPLPPPAASPGLFFVDNPGATQSILRVALPASAATDPDAMSDRLGMVVLGGTFTSRLNRLLREEKGYTYGARASLQARADHGRALATTAVRADVTAEALVDLLAEVSRVAEGVSEDELEKARGARRTDLVASFESRASTADALVELSLNGLPPTAIADELAALDAVTAEAVSARMAALPLDRPVVLVVGDLASVRAPVEAAVPGAWQVVGVE